MRVSTMRIVSAEKARTVPDSYPLSLNSLTLGCNQKTARDPVLNASEAEVQAERDHRLETVVETVFLNGFHFASSQNSKFVIQNRFGAF